jgi:hypothetical protein
MGLHAAYLKDQKPYPIVLGHGGWLEKAKVVAEGKVQRSISDPQ